MEIIKILSLVLGVFFLTTGLLKLFGHHHMVEEFNNFNLPIWLMKMTGLIEVVAAPMMISAYWNTSLAGIGALIMTPVMIGAMCVNFLKRPAWFGWGVSVLVGLCAYLSFTFLPIEDWTVLIKQLFGSALTA